MTTLILYTYCENQTSILKNTDSYNNFKFFLDKALINDNKYLFCININGIFTIKLDKYIEKYKNLKIFLGNGKSMIEAYLNILNNIDYHKFKNFIFISDKVRGPYYRNKNFGISKNWIDFYTSNLNNHNHNVIISAYGTSPMGKIYKFPYICIKFMVLNYNILKFIIENKFFEKNIYDTNLGINHTDPKNIFEIKLSTFLLDNNINYVSLDYRGILNLDILKYYKENNWNKLLEITQKLHQINDTTIKYRLFWTGNIMKKIFEDKDINYILNLNKIRETKNLGKW